LGPLLFGIYVNDLPSIVSSALFLFADDLKLHISLLYHDVDSLLYWTHDWLLNSSIPKCYMVTSMILILMDKKPLATSTCVKDLGIWIDDKLKFHKHTSVTITKANHILSIIKWSFNANMITFLRLCKKFIRPVLEYAIVAWGSTFLTDQRSLIQKWATRMVPEPWNISYTECLHHHLYSNGKGGVTWYLFISSFTIILILIHQFSLFLLQYRI